ncbi:glycerol-3-phosphate dehydrogenase/oxidase [Actinokineospora globicatena]|uniref:glycerol-3-phosphate dehydrogenase/oxidase n=1 Tax=Actinokineospora globicatena TaxID=103729 RepID=UPI0020A52BD3|nr:glycerol-3-phosphate dehydrogenase/oxidase [Actinokineospora globicatena]MCP2300731.1 glycerol-3-phosphate dehydrogenase [Actinokineospora globicatena]GLW77644.1 glycerol-3-phosphate dehydrogenase [Actinokineospora globicatena]GLW84480.1 glycerol-3-phosphate dehydrogenase [Actinokineospora globicatena]
MSTSSLNAERRAADLAAITAGEVVDVLVIGGGVTGAGVALDAAARGLSVALVEAEDLAFGTSRWSSKLVHGGLRYLAKGDVGLAHESAVERGVLMTTTAPHLTRTLPQLIPLHPPVSGRDAALAYTGLVAGDGLRRATRTPTDLLPSPRRVSAAEARALAPGLRAAGLRGGLLSFDGQLTDDARLVVALARTAAGLGARIITRAKVTGVAPDSVEVVDGLTGEVTLVRSRVVVNATGVWAGTLMPSVRLRPSRGSHLVVDAGAVGCGATSLTVPIPGSFGRFALVLPQDDGRVYIGLTDEPVDEIPDVPTVPESDVDFLLDVASSVLERRLTRADVLGSFAGLRPLVDLPSAAGRSADLSRHHAVLTEGKVVTVVGGKLTTYRRMAADAVDAATDLAGLSAGPSRTRTLPLVGAAPRTRLSTLDAPRRLVERYGTEAPTIAAMGLLDPDLGREIAAGITAAEVIWSVRHEGALTPDDVLHRRTRIALVTRDAETARPAVTDLVTRTLRGLVPQ